MAERSNHLQTINIISVAEKMPFPVYLDLLSFKVDVLSYMLIVAVIPFVVFIHVASFIF
jgi:hypothetical protein